MRFIFVTVMLVPFCNFNLAFAQKERVAAITNFRPGHNISLGCSVEQNSWQVHDFGSSVVPLNLTHYVTGLGVRYSFHANLVKKFGMIFGTGAQLNFDLSDGSGEFVVGHHVRFPSAAFGFVQNFLAASRAILFVEYAAAWLPWIRLKDATGERRSLSTLPDSFSVVLQMETFYDRSRSSGVSVSVQQVDLNCGASCFSNQNIPKMKGTVFALGVYHNWQILD